MVGVFVTVGVGVGVKVSVGVGVSEGVAVGVLVGAPVSVGVGVRVMVGVGVRVGVGVGVTVSVHRINCQLCKVPVSPRLRSVAYSDHTPLAGCPRFQSCSGRQNPEKGASPAVAAPMLRAA